MFVILYIFFILTSISHNFTGNLYALLIITQHTKFRSTERIKRIKIQPQQVTVLLLFYLLVE